MTKCERAAFQRCARETTESHTRPVALVELFATVGLVLSTIVAVTAVSIGIARADVFGVRADGDASSFAIGLLIGLLLLAMGGFTAVIADSPKGKA